MKKHFGFTLAEVLITLGIIGVVAAMTMPTLMNSTNGAQYRTAYKKALSVLSQAVVLNIALDDYDLSQTSTGTATDDANLYNMFNNRMNVIKTDEGSDDGTTGWNDGASSATAIFGAKASGNYTLYFNDGITFTFPKDAAGCTEAIAGAASSKCHGVIDVNGEKNPNKIVSCDDASDNTETAGSTNNCKVTNPTDMYPVVFYDQSILPNSPAGRAVLYGGK